MEVAFSERFSLCACRPLKATQIATSLARMLAAGMIVYGLVRGGLMLAVIGGFVWFTARNEYRNALLT